MTTTWYVLPLSWEFQVQVVQPRVCPGVKRAVKVTSPSFTSAPSSRTRSTGHGCQRLVVYRYWPLPPCDHRGVAAHDVDLGPGKFLHEGMAGDVVRMSVAGEQDLDVAH